MDLSPSTQGEQKNEQPQQVSSHSPSAQHTNKSPLIVSIPRSIGEQHITDTASNDTRLFGDTPSQLIVSIPYLMRTQRNTRSNKLIVSIPYPTRETHAEHEQSKQSHSDINSPIARKRLRTRTRGKKGQLSSTLQGTSPLDTPPAKRVHLDIPQQLAGSSRQYESDDSDTCIQQYESDNSLQSDDEHCETDEHSIASSSQTTPATCSNQVLEQKNEQPQQVSSHSPSAQHTNKSPLIVSIPRSIREQHITDTASNDTRLFGDTPSQLIVSIPYPMRTQRNTRSNKLIVSIPYPTRETHAEHEQSKQSHSDINSPLARKRLRTRTRGKKGQLSSTLQGTSPSDTPPAKRVHLDIPQQLAGSSRQYESDDSDTCIQQYESDNSLQSDDEHSVASSSQTTPATCSNQFIDLNEMYTEMFEARSKWYNLGLALGLDTGTLDSIDIEHKKCENCLREVLKQRDNTKKLTREEIDQALRQTTVQINTLANEIQEMASKQSLSTSSSQPSSDPTPECVVRYTSFLKDRYTQMSPFPDDWPPPLKEKFTKLALIERKKQICLTQAKHQPSIQYDYATGNVDNIVKRKKAITLEQIFEPLGGDSEIAAPNRYTVVMDGAPGVGKTTLSRKICIDWAEGKLIKDHHIVILKPLRELRGHTAASLSDLINADDPELKEQIVKYIQKTSGSGVMFIFDGFDELSSKQRSDKNTIFWKIIEGNRLHNCSVLVTSRSYASGPLQKINRVNRHVEVLGFKKKDIEHCIKQNVTDKKKAEKLIQMLKERLDIVSLCYIPLNCRIVLYVYQQQDTLPDTLTQLYEVFILYTVKHYKNKIFQEREHEIDNDQIEHANTIKTLPTQVIKCLDYLSETAFTGMTQDKLVFEYTEVTKERGALSLGLLNLIKCTGVLEAHYYQFLHLTIQEFLAARHLALTKSNKDKLEFITSKIDDDKFRMTLLFLSGLTQLDFFPIEQAFPASKSIDTRVEHKYKTKTKSLRKQERSRFLFLAHLQYESRQTTHNWLLPCLVTNSLNLSEHSFSQFDCLVLANFLALTPKDHVWDEINLSQCGLNDDRFKTLTTKKHSQRDLPVLCLTNQLDVTSNNINAEDLLMPLLSEESKVDSISIPHHVSCTQLGGAIVKKLVNFNFKFRQHSTDRTQTVLSSREVIIPTDSICSGILTTFLKLIKSEHLKRLSLAGPKAFEDCPDCSGSGNEAWESVCNVIKNSKHIQHLQIHKSQFHLHDIMAALQNKRKLRSLQIQVNTISHEGLIHLRNNLPVNVRAYISTSDEVKVAISIHKDKLVHVDIESPDEYIQDDDSEDLFIPFMPLLEEDLPSELHEVTVTTKSFMSKALLRSIGNSKTVTSLILDKLSNEKLTKYAGELRDMLKKTDSLQTLELDSCKLNNTSIKQLENGLLLNRTVALKLKFSYFTWVDSSSLNTLLTMRSQNLCELDILHTVSVNEENMRQLSEIVTTCKQLRVLIVKLSDNSESLFHALSDNQSLRELSIETTGKMATLLFQTLPSTSVTTLKLSMAYSKRLGDEVSLAFKEYIHGSKVVTVLEVDHFKLTEEAFKGITFTKDSPLRGLFLKNNKLENGWTELFNGLCSSCVTTLDVRGNSLNGEECCTALKRLLINNKTLTVLKIGRWRKTNHDMVCCVADALSQNCSLMELTINTKLTTAGWTKLFESLHENTTLNTLYCSEADLQKLESNNEAAKSVCEMLIHNQGLQNLKIGDEFIEGHLKEFAMAYIQRKPVLNLTVEKLEDDLMKEIEELETNTDKEYNIKNRY